MILQTFLISLLTYLCVKATPSKSASGSYFTATLESSRETRSKAIADLDLALQLVTDVRDNFPVCPPEPFPTDCEDILRSGQNRSGIYNIMPRSRATPYAFSVYCDMDTDGGGWTVIQRRGNFHRPKDFFFQNWQAYKRGFGSFETDFWLGNDNIFGLSNQRLCSVRFDLKAVDGSRRYAQYGTFWIDDEDHKYTLHISDYSGNAGDSMISMHNGQKFSTKDQQNDHDPPGKGCALKYKGGWWYNNCHKANLNGLYLRGKHKSYADGINWDSWKGYHESLEWTEIKIRSKNFKP